jgi:hypothetical protein
VDPREPDLRHRQIDGTLVFADISGFTSLTERLSKKGKVGAEEMNDLLDATFRSCCRSRTTTARGVIKVGRRRTPCCCSGETGIRPEPVRASVEMQRTMRSIGRLKTSQGG